MSDGNEQEIDAGLLPSYGNANITTDTTPTQGSQNPVESGGVFDALELKQDKLTGNDGQFVGFDAQGNPIAVDAPDMGTMGKNRMKKSAKSTYKIRHLRVFGIKNLFRKKVIPLH